MIYRADTIPWWLKPLYLIYSYTLGWFMYGLCLLLHPTYQIRFTGLENLSVRDNHIFSMWHTHLGPYFAVFKKHQRPHAWINHPLWFMKPIHILLECIGIKKIIFGSSGHGGKDAADKLVSYLKEGYSTVINPDGPAGPEKVLKKGVLYVAQASGVPVVPLKINVGWALKLTTWDYKKIPLPFTTIEVIYEKPILVTEENLESAEKYITQHMS